MLFMVIERFKPGMAALVGERFSRQGRMLPDNVAYQASWLVEDGSCCYQLMEAPDRDSMTPWTSRWDDLVDFEIVPVLTSAEFWAKNPTLK